MSENTEAMLMLLGLVVFFLVLPARWDPAVRLKEWNETRGRRR
jgi:hypothetical protein